MRVIDRVHSNATNRRTNTTPAHGAGLANLAQAMFFVADFANGGAALDIARGHFAGQGAPGRTCLHGPSGLAEAPAERTIWALPGIISMRWIVVPTGIFADRQGVAGADQGFLMPEISVAPHFSRARLMM